jgi:hypothetical protein
MGKATSGLDVRLILKLLNDTVSTAEVNVKWDRII